MFERRSVFYHLHTIFTFTRSDLKTIVYPQSAFGLFNALAGFPLVSCASPSITGVLYRLPRVLLRNWLNLMIFNMANQRLPHSILEDKVNKPWRNIPAGRVTAGQTRRLLCVTLVAVFVTTKYWLGGHYESLALMMFTWIYNDLGGSEEAYLTRNALNALGYIFFAAGSTRIATDQHDALTGTAWVWILLIGLVVTCTIQVQDLQDQKGDRLRNRRTVPLILGDAPARYTVACNVFVWSLFCPAYWRLGIAGFVAPTGIGFIIMARVLRYREPIADEKTFKYWCLWLILLYLLPLLKYPDSIVGYGRTYSC